MKHFKQGLICLAACASMVTPRAFAQTSAAASPGADALASLPAPNEALVSADLATRERMVREHPEQIPSFTQTVLKTVTEAEAIAKGGDYSKAQDRLNALSAVMPIAEVPSFDVQLLASFLAGRLNDPKAEESFRARAAAIREVELHRIGSGSSLTDPLQVDFIFEMREWVRVQLGASSDMRLNATDKGNVYSIIFSAPSSAPRVVYFQMPKAVEAAAAANVDAFKAIPFENMTPKMKEGYQLAEARRSAFLLDTSFNYLDLISAEQAAIEGANALTVKGDYRGALDRLNQLSSIRPVEEIPLIRLLELYSAILGHLGERTRQDDMRAYLFGLEQVMAHSGDGLTAATAIKVVAVQEEYVWIAAKRLKFIKQSLQGVGDRHYDVMSCTGANQQTHDYYFDVTEAFSREALSLQSPPK